MVANNSHWDYVYQISTPTNLIMGQYTDSSTPIFTGQFDTGIYAENSNATSLPQGYTWVVPTPVYAGNGYPTGAFGSPVQIIGQPQTVRLDIGASQYVLCTIPAWVPNGVIITDMLVTCTVGITGTLVSTNIKVGTTGGSFNELLGSSGYTFNTATSATLLPVGNTIKWRDLYPITTTSLAPDSTFTGTNTNIIMSVSGGTMTTGTLSVTLLGLVY